MASYVQCVGTWRPGVAYLKLRRYLQHSKLKSILARLALELSADEISLEVNDSESDGYTSWEDVNGTVRQRNTSRSLNQDFGSLVSLDDYQHTQADGPEESPEPGNEAEKRLGEPSAPRAKQRDKMPGH